MPNFIHKDDLPDDVTFSDSVAIDTEAMGLMTTIRDRLCVLQISDGKGDVHIVHFVSQNYISSKNLLAVFGNTKLTKIFHCARFDMRIIYQYFNVMPLPCYCTKIASRIARTYTDNHSLKDLCYEFLEIKLNKQQQCSDWGRTTLTQEQIYYAANDVLYLHRIKLALDKILEREHRAVLAETCFDALKAHVMLDAKGWKNEDVFGY